MLKKMPGDRWQQFANLRNLYSYMYSMPGKKINFMGNEFGQNDGWDFTKSLDWHLLEWNEHKGIKRIFQDLNALYKEEGAFYETDFLPSGFEFINHSDCENSVIAYLRKSKNMQEQILIIINFTPTPRINYKLDIQHNGEWEVIFNSDSSIYNGSNAGSQGLITANHHSIYVDLPPLGTMFLKWKGKK
jgi:1,4-alpha-glucan branching enzyme